MKIKDIYAMKPVSVDSDVYGLRAHVPEIDFNTIAYEANTRVNVKDHTGIYIDGYRTWVIFSVWFDGEPVMLCQEAGRGGREHRKRFITNVALYWKMVTYFRTLLKESELEDVYSAEYEGDDVACFYGSRFEPGGY